MFLANLVELFYLFYEFSDKLVIEVLISFKIVSRKFNYKNWKLFAEFSKSFFKIGSFC